MSHSCQKSVITSNRDGDKNQNFDRKAVLRRTVPAIGASVGERTKQAKSVHSKCVRNEMQQQNTLELLRAELESPPKQPASVVGVAFDALAQWRRQVQRPRSRLPQPFPQFLGLELTIF